MLNKHQQQARTTCARLLMRALLLVAISTILSDRNYQFSIAPVLASAHVVDARSAQSTQMTPNDLSWATNAQRDSLAADLETNAISAPIENYEHHRQFPYSNYPKSKMLIGKYDEQQQQQQQKKMKADSSRNMLIVESKGAVAPEQQSMLLLATAAAATQAQKQERQSNELAPQTHEDCLKIVTQLKQRFVEQVIRQRMADKDHLLMEKWLVDNINDLHRELKQTEMDFEHYVQVTKRIFLENNDEQAELKRQLAARTSLTLSVPLTTSSASASNFLKFSSRQPAHDVVKGPTSASSLGNSADGATSYRRHQYHLTKMLVANDNAASRRKWTTE